MRKDLGEIRNFNIKLEANKIEKLVSGEDVIEELDKNYNVKVSNFCTPLEDRSLKSTIYFSATSTHPTSSLPHK